MQTDQGLFVSFDGVPRSGRKAQADRLAAAVKEEEYEVVRVHLDWGDPPNPKVTRRWLSDVFEQYEKMVTDVVRPAMERGAVVIADNWITSALIRVQMFSGMQTAEAFIYEERAMRMCPVDIEYLFGDVHDGAASSSSAAANTRSDSVCSTPNSPVVVAPCLGARRRLLYLVKGGGAESLAKVYAIQVINVLHERKGDAWAAVIGQTQEQRDTFTVQTRMAMWQSGTLPLMSMLATWGRYSDDVKAAAFAAMPPYIQTAGLKPELIRSAGEFLRIARGMGYELDSYTMGLVAKKNAEADVMDAIEQPVAEPPAITEGAASDSAQV